MIGQRLKHYRIVDKIGAGGMGEVYRAHDERLERDVALKVLPTDTVVDESARKRFRQEALTLSKLKHPHIAHVYDYDTDDGVDFLVMEFVEGTSLKEKLSKGSLPEKEVARLGAQLTDALAEAHEQGVIHRDIKPGNIVLTNKGQAKVLDFGLAKLVESEAKPAEAATVDSLTQPVGVAGTLAYMAPEQLAGETIDARTDIYSSGVVLYEMATGRRPFEEKTATALAGAILHQPPQPPSTRNRRISPGLQNIILKCLEKEPERRYQSAKELRIDLERLGAGIAVPAAPRPRSWSIAAILRRPAVAAVAVLLAALVIAATWLWVQRSRARWAREEALPEITRLIEAGELYEAYRLALQAEKYIPGDTELQEVRNRITIPISIVTEPAGAQVSIKGYSTPNAPWEPLGETPLERVRIPYALMRWKISKEGFEPFEGAPFGEGPFVALATGFRLDPVGTRPAGMVRVPGGPLEHPDLPSVELSDYWIDRYEVTNRQFKEFVDQGGYQKPEYWTQPFRDDGRELSREEAMGLLRDATGRPGPATWELGAYAEGRDDFPVSGVSWYEAAAYCTFAGKSLPTVYHWYKATAQDQLSDVLRFSNFGAEGLSAVGSHQGMGDYGTYDMAGNVKEWCWNETGGGRYILGGSWGEPTYMYKNLDIRRSFDRTATHGFRCARYDPTDETMADTATPSIKFRLEEPVGDDVFAAYRSMYAYDRTNPEAAVEAVDDSSPHWRKETVSFSAAYGNERVTAFLFLPRNATPPYETVIWFPGSDVFVLRSSQSLASAFLFDFIPRSGRALVYPVYKGMYERYVPFSRTPNERRDMMIQWSKDVGRTIDYLETRPDIDTGKLAYYGFSLGAIHGPIVTAIDNRFSASVLLGAGSQADELPGEMSVHNFAPRSSVPTLMVGGRDDFLLPVESYQRPFFRLLGAPEGEKRLALLEGGHIPSDRREIIREVLDWLDLQLGPVAMGAAHTAPAPSKEE
jgi:predicted Ser/Thr protein kinase/pimeloyl-ACP methyl ester carboxylesterase